MSEQLEFLKLIAKRLDSANIPYMLTGSMALAIYATPRMTRDIDIVIECQLQDVENIVRLFKQDCYIDKESVHEAISRRSIFNIIHNNWVLKADFIIRKDSDYRELELSRRKRYDIEGVQICVVSPEDLILSKLEWSKESGSELQNNDIRVLLSSVENLDREYLEKWAQQLGVANQLQKARAL